MIVSIAILVLFTLVVTAWLFFRRSVAYTERQCFHPFHYEDQSVLSRDDAFIFAATDEPLPTGWQGWEGGRLSFNPNQSVVVMFINGELSDYESPAGDFYGWDHDENDYDCQYNIVAYRLAS